MTHGMKLTRTAFLFLLFLGCTLPGQSPASKPQQKKAQPAAPEVVVHFVVLGVT